MTWRDLGIVLLFFMPALVAVMHLVAMSHVLLSVLPINGTFLHIWLSYYLAYWVIDKTTAWMLRQKEIGD